MRIYQSLIVIVILFLAGCTHTIILLSPEDLYALGNYYMEDGNYRVATDQFERIRDDYPTSDYATMSQFKLAEAQYFRKNYSKASIEFELFLEFNPGHKLAPQAQYYLAMSKFHSILSPERDTTIALDAKSSLEEFLNRYPDHPDTVKVKGFLHDIIDHLQMHEIEVGRAYFRMGLYDAALNRLVPVTKVDVSDAIRQEALYYIAKSLIRTHDREQAREYLMKAAAIDTGNKYQQRAKKALKSL
ncbi:outer membrane protein assembly factor BamD [bacterium]|nr:outer membrane protein assembly factor BamD [candidate division CSSED10-310 bacterium]